MDGHSITDWILAVTTAIYTFITFRTLRAIKRQSDIAKDAADAALLNAKAVVNSERAWILVDVEFSPGNRGMVDGTIVEGGIQRDCSTVAVRLKCRNDGNTPGWITEIRACFRVVPALADVPALEFTELIYQGCEPVGARGTPFSKDHALTFWYKGELPANPFGETGIIYGVVRYSDAISHEARETFFGYQLPDRTSLQRLSGYPAYNKST